MSDLQLVFFVRSAEVVEYTERIETGSPLHMKIYSVHQEIDFQFVAMKVLVEVH